MFAYIPYTGWVAGYDTQTGYWILAIGLAIGTPWNFTGRPLN